MDECVYCSRPYLGSDSGYCDGCFENALEAMNAADDAEDQVLTT